MFNRFIPSAILLAAAALCGRQVGAAEQLRTSALTFGAQITQECDEKIYGDQESAQLAAWAVSFLAKSVVGVAGAALERAAQPKNVTKHAFAHGNLYLSENDGETWEPSPNLCVRYWRAEVSNIATQKDFSQQGVDDVLAKRWRDLGFSDLPYLYGEIRVSLSEQTNLLSLDPVVIFMRKQPEADGFWRKSESVVLALDLTALGADRPFASLAIDMPDIDQGPVLLKGLALTGTGSGHFAAPPPQADNQKGNKQRPVQKKKEGAELRGGQFNVLATFTSNASATLLASTLVATFKEDKQKLIDAVTPRSADEKKQQQQTAIVTAFDAIGVVLEAERTLSANQDETKKRGLTNELNKVKYLADQKLIAAGLPTRYNVTLGPSD